MGLVDRVLGRRDRERQRRLAAASAAVDRELAANLELAAMFGQTRQAVVLENGEFARHRAVLESELPSVFDGLRDLYARIPDAESAMERRGPAGSLRPEDRSIVEGWEGDARSLQRELRSAAAAPPPSLASLLLGRLRGGPSGRG